jgi:hypothetical protein
MSAVSGWNVAARNDRPAISPTQAPAQPNPNPPQTAPAKPAELDYEKLASTIVGKMAEDERFRGPPGPTGQAGPAGERGPPGEAAKLDYDQLAAAVMAKLPPTRVQFLDGKGSVSQEFIYQPGEPILLPPTFVKQLDRNGKVFDEQAFPLNTPVILRYGANTEAR